MPIQKVNAELVALLRPHFMDNLLARDSDTYNDTVPKVVVTDADGGLRLDHAEFGNCTGAGEGDVMANGFFRLRPGTTLTIAGGVVTAVGSFHVISTEGGAAADDLDTVNGNSDFAVLVMCGIGGGRTVTFKDGTGNLLLSGDFVANSSQDTITLLSVGADWRELCRSNNA